MLEVQSINIEPIMNDKKSISFKIKTNDPIEIKNLVSWQENTRDLSKPILDIYKDCILMCRDSDDYLKSEFLIRKCFVKFIQRNGEEVDAEIYSSYAPDELDLEEYSNDVKLVYILY